MRHRVQFVFIIDYSCDRKKPRKRSLAPPRFSFDQFKDPPSSFDSSESLGERWRARRSSHFPLPLGGAFRML
jgi:hypothetical protein